MTRELFYAITSKIDEKYISLFKVKESDFNIFTGDSIEKPKKKFEEGLTYTLQEENVEGYEMPKRCFKLIKHVEKYNDYPINSVIVKSADNYQGQIFTLTKTDCKTLGIDFEEGLEIFPSELNFVRNDGVVEEEKKFVIDDNDLSTYPTSFVDGRIHKMLVSISGFEDYHSVVFCPNGLPISKKFDCFSFTMLGYGIVNYSVITLERDGSPIIDGTILFELRFSNNNGINPLLYKERSLNDCLKVSISQNSVTNDFLEEYGRSRKMVHWTRWVN